MDKEGKKPGTGHKGPTVNRRCGDYNGNNIIPIKAGKMPNPTENSNTIRVYSIPMTAKQEAKVGAIINI